MRNNLLVTILFLFSCSFLLSQDIMIKNIEVDSKNNGTVIQLDSNKKVNLEDVTAWYSSEWFYMTIYGANADSLSLTCLLYTSPSPRDLSTSRMPSSA